MMSIANSLRSLLVVIASASATCPCEAEERFLVLADASLVRDAKTGLIWRRCVEGMVWSGSGCGGSPLGFTTIYDAFAFAGGQPGWRIPSIKELASLIDRNRPPPTIDPVAFPGAPGFVHWSSTPYQNYGQWALFVNFDNGHVGKAQNVLAEPIARLRLVKVEN